MDLPWISEVKGAVEHAKQFGMLVSPTGQIERRMFCECESEKFVGKNLNYTTIEFHRKQLSCIFNSDIVSINNFCTNIFKQNIHGNALVYVRHQDLEISEIQEIIQKVK